MNRQARSQTFFTAAPGRLTALFLVLMTGVAASAVQCQSGDYKSALAIAGIASAAGLLLYLPFSTQRVLICWFAAAPLAAFYVRFPTNRSIVTSDRVVFAVLVLVLLLSWERNEPTSAGESATSLRISKFEVAWGLLAALALASAITRAGNIAYAARLAVDVFVLPLVAFHIARNSFDLRRAGKHLFMAAIALALFLLVTGAFEFATGIDLFAFKGAEIVREGERRVNGPFATDSSFAVICLLLFVFLQAAPRMFHLRLDRGARFLYASALGAAVLGALLPLFRAVGLALVACWMFLSWSAREVNRETLHRRDRRLAIAPGVAGGAILAVILIAVAGWVTSMAPSIAGSRLTDPRTAFGRLATWQAAIEITLDNPVFGAGLGNYPNYFDATHYYADEPPEEVLATRAVDSPHSNALWISSELGLTGFLLYIAANAYLFLMGWRAFKKASDRRQRVTASCFLALIFAYWIPGLTLSSGYYSDLNLCFFFLTGALSGSFAGSREIPIPNTSSAVPDCGN
ncbi:MAG TPA: O-antigen ligase family protein [Blastocatellia bacterium]|nr:O-antigen ligase family protein [Blastocatellia bacterium]